MCGGVADVINCAKFFENPSKGFGAVKPRKTAFPIGIVHRHYNSVGTTVPHCDKNSFSRDGVLFSIDFFVYFFVSLLGLARLRENGCTDLHEMFREGAE